MLRGAALGDPRIVVRDVTAVAPGLAAGRGAVAGAVPGPAGRAARLQAGPRTDPGRRRPSAHRRRLRRRHRGPARLRRDVGRRADRRSPRRRPGRRVVAGRAGPSGARRRAASPRSSAAAPSCSPRRPATSGWPCSRRSSSRIGPGGCAPPRLTSFLGRTLTELDAGGEELTDELADRLRGWALLLRGRGVAALFEATEERGLTARVLGTVGGERLLTDLRHVAQTLHETARRESLGLTGLLEWLRSERENASSGARPPSRQRRRGGADHDGPPEQGPAVPRRPPALRVDELRPAGRRRPLPRRARHPDARRRPVAARRGPPTSRPISTRRRARSCATSTSR